MATDSFVFYRSFVVALEKLSPDDFKTTIIALADYALDDKDTPELSGVPQMAMSFMKPLMDSNKRKRSNGQLGGLNSGKTRRSKPKQTEAKRSNSEKPRSNGHGHEDGHEDEAEHGHNNIDGAIECEISNPKELFLHYWKNTPDVFNIAARIEKPKEWNKFWNETNITCDQVKTAMDNFIADVRCSSIERRYIPARPDRFVLNGWITRCQERHSSRETTSTTNQQNKKALRGLEL